MSCPRCGRPQVSELWACLICGYIYTEDMGEPEGAHGTPNPDGVKPAAGSTPAAHANTTENEPQGVALTALWCWWW